MRKALNKAMAAVNKRIRSGEVGNSRTKVRQLARFAVQLKSWKRLGISPASIAHELGRNGFAVSATTVRRAYAMTRTKGRANACVPPGGANTTPEEAIPW